MAVANTLAYYITATIATIKSLQYRLQLPMRFEPSNLANRVRKRNVKMIRQIAHVNAP